MKNWIPEKEYKNIFSKVPRLCVDLVIQTKSGVVLSQRDIVPWKGYWHLPGGSVCFGETIKKAAERIAKAELGIKIKIEKVLGYAEFPEEIKMVNRYSISIVLLCSTSVKKISGSWQAKNTGFFTQLPKPMIATHAKILKNYNKSLN